MGLLAFLANGQKSYWTQYSTILWIRTKQSWHMGRGVIEIREGDKNGSSPLPGYIAGAKVRLASEYGGLT